MSINSVSGPSVVASTAAAPTNVKSQSAAQPPSQSAATAAVVKSAVSAVVQEAKETPGQTLSEAASGDRQAQKRLHSGHAPATTGSVIDTKA
ncbi:MAG TPA: hypothetical protein VNY82_00110 [Steroidobacteraceae bacterium]|jgi:hypothetical protein|nr:hypothetical protein [Steroidobacteraceae bacterium]